MADRKQRSQRLFHEAIGQTVTLQRVIGSDRTAADHTGDAGALPDASTGWMAAGMTIGKYELIRPLGHGGMGSVFLARHIQLAQRVAIKSLLVRPARVPEDSERLLAEAQTTA